jgi:hypothetical protein
LEPEKRGGDRVTKNICSVEGPCFARQDGRCTRLRNITYTDSCPFQKERQELSPLESKILKLYRDHYTIIKIGIEVGHTEEFVSGVVERLIEDGLLTRRSADRYQSRDQMEVAKQLHAQGLNCGEIGRALSIPKTTLQTWARKGLI